LNTNFSKITSKKSVQPGLHTTFRHALALVAFALLSSFSGAAVSRTVYKCLQANGQYEFTDKKCVAPVSGPVQEQSVPEVSTANSEVKRADPPHADAIAQPHEALPARAPLEAQPKQAPLSNGSAIPSAPLKNNNPTS
jgi:hypothetical protein